MSRRRAPSKEASLVIPARGDALKAFLEEAKLVDPSDHRARVRFCKRAVGKVYERGETSAALAATWGLAKSTVWRDMSIAWAETKEAADPEVDQQVWWYEIRREIDASNADIDTIAGVIEGMKGPDGSLVLKPSDAKMVSEALAKVRESKSKVMEQYGRATGAIQGSVTQVAVVLGGEKARVAGSEAGAMVERCYAFFAEDHPELLAEFVAWVSGSGSGGGSAFGPKEES